MVPIYINDWIMVLICSPTNRFKEQKFVSDEVRTFSSYAITFKFTTLSRVHTFCIQISSKNWRLEKTGTVKKIAIISR